MNKSTISKIVILISIFTIITCISTVVFAEDPIDLTPSLTGGNTETGDTTPESPTPENTTPESPKPESPTPENTNPNTSKYKETIPYAGPAETILLGVAFVVCGIIGVYTFMKMSDYSNI